jgi:purine-binding chemotaxis protein CheW
MTLSQQYCTFYLGDQCFGLDVLRVQEIIRQQAMTCVPLAHRVVRGLINLRGQIVTAIDLRRRLDLPDRAEDCEAINVVVHTDNGAVSLIVDEIGDVVDVTVQPFERPPETLSGPARELVEGVYKLPGKLLLILNPDLAVSIPGN